MQDLTGCIGCKDYQEAKCIGIRNDLTHLCPCTKCIIKMMCKDPCREYTEIDFCKNNSGE